MSTESRSIRGVMGVGEVGMVDDAQEIPKQKKRSFREILGLHEDRVGPIPGGLAAWLGSVIIWVTLVWVVFGVLLKK